MLRTKSILEPRKASDGLRISVMSRHTLDDGYTPHPDINDLSYDRWMKTLAPPAGLVGDYYRRALPWSEFEKGYKLHISKPEVKPHVQKLARDSLDDTITLLCIEASPEFCHGSLLAEECS